MISYKNESPSKLRPSLANRLGPSPFRRVTRHDDSHHSSRLVQANNVYVCLCIYVVLWQTVNGRPVALKLFRAYSGYIRHETFSFMMSLPAMSLGLRFCVSRKGGTGGGGWVVQTAWLRLGSSLEATWLALGGPFLSFLA